MGQEERCENVVRRGVKRNRGAAERCGRKVVSVVWREDGGKVEEKRVCGRCARSRVEGRQRDGVNPWQRS